MILLLSTSYLNASESSEWLKSEIDTILNAYKNTSFSNVLESLNNGKALFPNTLYTGFLKNQRLKTISKL